ncbi:NAD-dependent epimerase/dehydratase family protein [Gordonia rhizosphera]|uniref:NAD-dependent epimerase/dehydratase family protein n=1 Tax=Gordonia rhizosphera NBRC 16068 TaxID=1108045 RepID=K6W0G7_9ACTN|nr:NAD-dependent epimerase/dehydratase family protein [Gordonia rhizosphera]GAB92660.1 NAD-dependent epimerase/dehydratase family protein [Gordonia rhizosphera NBRC 16068]
MRVLITGATGFVGGWIAKAVHEHGHEVRFLVRNPDKLGQTAQFLGFDASDVVIGDMQDVAAVDAALDGCDAVIHAAADVALQSDGGEDLRRRNTSGAHNVIGGAVERGLDPIICVSSSAVLWDPGLDVVQEDQPIRGGGDAYANSKGAVDKFARELQSEGKPVVLTYPTTVIGPSAHGRFGESGDAVVSFIKSGVIGRSAGLTIVDVRDVAEAHARMLDRDRGPRRYVVGGTHVDGGELAAILTEASGTTVRHIALPNAMLIGLGKLADRFRSRVPDDMAQLSEGAVRYLLHAPRADNSTAEKDLDISFRTPRESIVAVCDEHKKSTTAQSN